MPRAVDNQRFISCVGRPVLHVSAAPSTCPGKILHVAWCWRFVPSAWLLVNGIEIVVKDRAQTACPPMVPVGGGVTGKPVPTCLSADQCPLTGTQRPSSRLRSSRCARSCRSQRNLRSPLRDPVQECLGSSFDAGVRRPKASTAPRMQPLRRSGRRSVSPM